MAPISPLPISHPPIRARGRLHISRFTQLLLFSCLVLFLPTYLYLRPSQHRQQGAGIASSQGWGPISNDDSPLEPAAAAAAAAAQGSTGDSPWDKWVVDPVKMKSGDFWKAATGGWTGKGPVDVSPKGKPAGIGAGVAAGGDLPAANGAQAFAQKMANATAKAELGRHTWHFLHLLTLRFPDKPTPEQRTTLSTFFHTFSLLYPCGECANHFQDLLREMPVQTSSRMSAALWLCSAHNRVNERLGKPEFPCDKLDESYDCGCGGPDPLSSKTILLGGPASSPLAVATASLIKPATAAAPSIGLSPRDAEGEEDRSGDWIMARTEEECRICRRAVAEGS